MTLDKFQIGSVFNVCGALAEESPQLIRKLYDTNHEISSHGYAHEDFLRLNPKDIDTVLGKTEQIIEGIIDEKPIGFRPPWLRCNNEIYSIAEKRGYRWVSSVYVPQVERLFRPDYFYSSACRVNAFKHIQRQWKRTVIKVCAPFYKKEPFKPFRSKKLYEIPLLSTMDYDLIGPVDPRQKSPKILLKFAYEALKKQFERSKVHFNLNFHVWLIGSSNRLHLLEKILNFVSNQETKFLLARELIKERNLFDDE